MIKILQLLKTVHYILEYIAHLVNNVSVSFPLDDITENTFFGHLFHSYPTGSQDTHFMPQRL